MTISSVGEWRNKQWTNEESTNAILQRDTGVDVHGSDKTWRETKTEQQTYVGAVGAAKCGLTGLEAAEIAGVIHGGAALTIALPVGVFVAGWAGLVHAHEDGDAQKAALRKDEAHVALAGALDLPGACKDHAFGDRSDVSRAPGSKAFKMTETIMKDPAGLGVLQAHCDRGVMSAYAAIPTPIPDGMTLDKFLESRPQLKQICDEDAAFKVGFESFWHAGVADRKALLDNVAKHDLRAGNGVHIGV